MVRMSLLLRYWTPGLITNTASVGNQNQSCTALAKFISLFNRNILLQNYVTVSDVGKWHQSTVFFWKNCGNFQQKQEFRKNGRLFRSSQTFGENRFLIYLRPKFRQILVRQFKKICAFRKCRCMHTINFSEIRGNLFSKGFLVCNRNIWVLYYFQNSNYHLTCYSTCLAGKRELLKS